MHTTGPETESVHTSPPLPQIFVDPALRAVVFLKVEHQMDESSAHRCEKRPEFDMLFDQRLSKRKLEITD
jgi:hypothetical protein